MYSLFLADPIRVFRSAFATNLALSLPVASIDRLTLDALLPPTRMKDINQTGTYIVPFLKLTDPFYSSLRLA